MRKTKIISTITIYVLTLVLLLSSCSNTNAIEQTELQNNNETTPVTEEIAKQEYLYERELNVIDDKYRNYYEVFVYSYCDSDGDGIGDINGLISKLDYIKDMGFNGIWLMPVMQSNTYHKYDVVDYYSIDKEYGTLDDFKQLVLECHKRDINLIIDLVLNHTSSYNEWFKNAKKEIYDNVPLEERKYYNYYNFVNEEGFTKSGYTQLGFENYYYESVFWDQMPDLNLSNPDVREEIENIAKFWLDIGVDGFRLDAAKEFTSGNTDANIEVLTWFNDYCKSISSDCYIVAEVWDSFTNYTQYYKSGIDSVFDFTLADAGGRVATVLKSKGQANSAMKYCDNLKTIDTTIHAINPDAIDAPFINNHDLGRATGYFSGNERLIKTACGMNLMTSGSTFVYYGEEIGMSGSGRDENKREPMIWSSDSTEMTNGPSAMESQEQLFKPLDEQLDDENSIANYYKRALRIRNENPEIARGKIDIITLGDDDLCAVTKTYDNSVITVIYNLSAEEKTLDLSHSGIPSTEIRGYLTSDYEDVVSLDGNILSIPQYSIIILK